MNTTETKILKDGEISSEILKIIREANKHIVIVSPYNKFWIHLKNEIKQATNRNIRVEFVCRKDQLEADKASIDWLLEQGVNVYAVERLHSKIYFNETDALITSMNLLETSVLNSKEIAVLIRDKALIEDTRKYADELIKLGMPQTAKARATSAKPKTAKSKVVPETRSGRAARGARRTAEANPAASIGGILKGIKDRFLTTAYCVRCDQSMELNGEKPLCDGCYRMWSRYKDPDYKENYCHGCGEKRDTTYAKPFCRPCYKEYS